MSRNRLLLVVLAGAIVIVAVLTIRTSFATAAVTVAVDRFFHTPPMSDYKPVDNSFHTPPMSDYKPVDNSFHTPPMSDYNPVDNSFHTPPMSDYRP